MPLGLRRTITGKRHRKTGTADQSTPTQTMFSGEKAHIQPARAENPLVLNGEVPAGAAFEIYMRRISVPSLVNDGDVVTDDLSREFVILDVQDHDGPLSHLILTARLNRKLTRVAA